MTAQQILFPFRASRTHRRQSNLDLVGRQYSDDYVTVTVVGVSPADDRYVLVKRQPGTTRPMLAWLMRSIFDEEDKQKKLAA